MPLPRLPVTISAGGASGVLQVAAGAMVAMNDPVIRDGCCTRTGWCTLNSGNLSLDRVVVTDNEGNDAQSPDPGLFALGGGGIYSGTDAVDIEPH